MNFEEWFALEEKELKKFGLGYKAIQRLRDRYKKAWDASRINLTEDPGRLEESKTVS